MKPQPYMLGSSSRVPNPLAGASSKSSSSSFGIFQSAESSGRGAMSASTPFASFRRVK